MQLRLAALVLGLVLLSISVVATVRAGQQRARADLGERLTTEAVQQAAVLQNYFERARTIDLLMARNAAFTEFYAGTADRGAANHALGYLEHLYPGRIQEVCFIDRSGRENARVVGGRAARRDELSPHEERNAFFAPTFALGSGTVYQAPPYRSPDTDEWVISNSTVVPSGPGAGRATVHFEVALDSFRREAARGLRNARVRIVDAVTRRVVIDTARPQRHGAPAGRVGVEQYRAIARAATGSANFGGRLAASRRLARTAGNANDWIVVVTPVHASATGWWRSFGLANAAMTAAALLLLAFALTSFRAYQRTLRDATLHDELTGLPNRRLFRDRLRQAALTARRDGALAAALIIDLDRFKEVNDTLGHHKGDQLLREVGARLRSTLRDSDTVARFGGDEFAVLVPRVATPEEAAEVAGRIADALQSPFLLDGVAVIVGASIGIALAPVDGEDPDGLVRRGDIAMYEAKRGNQPHAFYSSERDPYSSRRLAMVGDLRAAIDARGLDVHYQPKVDLVTGAVHGVEALARWQHPELGSVPPSEFVPLAEQTGLIKPMTKVILEAALGQARQWADDELDLTVSVNISMRDLLDPELPAEIAAVLHESGVAADRLELEITESMIMSDPERALEVLMRLDAMGVGLAIDDFGTGYSSLAHLKRLPVDELKIDRGFVMSMSSDQADAFIVRCAVDLGRNLGMRVVAEGVEDAPTAAVLAELGCSTAQGYFFSRPVPARELTAWLAARAAAPPRA